MTVRADVPMHIEISDHAAIDHLSLDEVPRQGDSVGLDHLSRDGELDLARQLGVLALLSRLDGIP